MTDRKTKTRHNARIYWLNLLEDMPLESHKKLIQELSAKPDLFKDENTLRALRSANDLFSLSCVMFKHDQVGFLRVLRDFAAKENIKVGNRVCSPSAANFADWRTVSRPYLEKEGRPIPLPGTSDFFVETPHKKKTPVSNNEKKRKRPPPALVPPLIAELTQESDTTGSQPNYRHSRSTGFIEHGLGTPENSRPVVRLDVLDDDEAFEDEERQAEQALEEAEEQEQADAEQEVEEQEIQEEEEPMRPAKRVKREQTPEAILAQQEVMRASIRPGNKLELAKVLRKTIQNLELLREMQRLLEESVQVCETDEKACMRALDNTYWPGGHVPL